MVFVIEGIPYIISPSKMKAFIKRIDEVPEKTLRIIGLIAAFSGLGIIYIARMTGGN